MNLPGFFRRSLQFTIALFVLAQFFTSVNWMRTSMAPAIEYPNRSYAEKMRAQWRDYYDLMLFIQTETPRDAILWLDSSSHDTLEIYFLYPRQRFYNDPRLIDAKQVEYVILTGEGKPPIVSGERKMLDAKRGLVVVQR